MNHFQCGISTLNMGRLLGLGVHAQDELGDALGRLVGSRLGGREIQLSLRRGAQRGQHGELDALAAAFDSDKAGGTELRQRLPVDLLGGKFRRFQIRLLCEQPKQEAVAKPSVACRDRAAELIADAFHQGVEQRPCAGLLKPAPDLLHPRRRELARRSEIGRFVDKRWSHGSPSCV
ncbi:MAG TPA: hypothetical protein VGE52_12325, partial [Pirellulales bacterium]